jgi:hypothetical protein
MKTIRAQFTIRQLLLAVAFAAVLAFNLTLVERLWFSAKDGIRPAAFVGSVRVLSFTVCACVVGAFLGCFTGLTLWRSTPTTSWPSVRGAIAGLVAGFLSWFFAMIVVLIGYGVDGQAPLSALLMGVVGAAFNAVPGAVLASCWVWFTRPRVKMP